MNKIKLKSIEIQNFRPFKGDNNKFDFDSENHQPVILVQANNGSGKTSLLMALKWAFYGIGGIAYYKTSPQEMVNRVAKTEEDGETSVKVVFQHDDHSYTLKRSFKFSKTNKLEWLEEELNNSPVLVPATETPKERMFKIQKKVEKEMLIEFNNIVNKISRTEEINPTLFFSKQNQKILMNNTLTLGLEEALNRITKWRTELIIEPFTELINDFGISS